MAGVESREPWFEALRLVPLSTEVAGGVGIQLTEDLDDEIGSFGLWYLTWVECSEQMLQIFQE